MRKTILIASLVLFAACRSTTPVLPMAPTAPTPNISEAAPAPPIPPRAPIASKSIELPVPPKGRLQTIDEVYENIYWDDAVPRKFPFDTKELVVVAMPPRTSDSHRLSMIGAFLAAGFRVKDAGNFGSANFLIDNHPWWHSAGESFLRRVSTGEAQPPKPEDAPPADEAEERTYRGFGGMKLSLTDPTSLWAPDLLSNQNLQSDFFIRLFSMEYTDTSVRVERRQVFEPEAVTAFRGEVERVNARVRSHNAEVRAFRSAAKRYDEEYDIYRDQFDDWKSRQESRYKREHKAYEIAFKAWKTTNAGAIAAARANNTLPAGTRTTPSKIKKRAISERRKSAAKLPDMKLARVFETKDLDEAMASVVKESIPSRRIDLAFEVIDSKTGEVAQATQATGISRSTWSESRLLREVLKGLTKRR